MNPAGATAPHGLKFHWPRRAPFSLALAGFLLLSVLAHGLAFYILQVVDPPEVVIPPPPVQVNLLTPNTPENRALLQWIDAEDPAAIANTHEIVPGTLYDLSYQRSLADTLAMPKSPADTRATVPFPPAAEATAIIGSAQASTPAPPAVMIPLPTELRFSGELSGRKIAKKPPMKFDSGPLSGQPARFMVGVGPDGRVIYTFLLGTDMDEGAKAANRQAEDYLEKIEFAPRAGAIAWGIATFYWGDDSDGPAGAKP